MKRRTVVLSLLVAQPIATPLTAQRAHQFEVTAAGGYHTYGNATELEAQFGLAARLGYWFYGPLSLEGEFNYARPQPTNDLADRVAVSTFAGWLLANLPVGSSGSLFLKGGYGATSYGKCPDVALPGAGPCGSVGVLQGGAGARVAILPSVQFRVDGVLNTSLSERRFSNALVQGGVSFLLGGRPSPDLSNADPDADGVPDRRDRCPGTARGSRVDAVGCSHDADGDLYPDGIDACPDTPAGATVDKRGCPADADGDGVLDSTDRCPDTGKGVTVDTTGCPNAPAPSAGAPAAQPAPAPPVVTPAPQPTPRPPVAQPRPAAPADTAKARPTRADTVKARLARVVILPGTIWNYRASAINATGFPVLDSVVALLRENPSLVAEVQGYAHDRLVPSDNTLLSSRRAEAIKSYIVSKGVTAGRVTAVGLGSQTLLVSDTTDAARITNRRVEVHLGKRP